MFQEGPHLLPMSKLDQRGRSYSLGSQGFFTIAHFASNGFGIQSVRQLRNDLIGFGLKRFIKGQMFIALICNQKRIHNGQRIIWQQFSEHQTGSFASFRFQWIAIENDVRNCFSKQIALALQESGPGQHVAGRNSGSQMSRNSWSMLAPTVCITGQPGQSYTGKKPRVAG